MRTATVEQPECESAIASALISHKHLQLKNILVPTDFSGESIKAVDYGAALAEQFDAVLWLLHIVVPAPAFAGFEGIPVMVGEGQEAADAKGQLAEFAARNIPPEVAVKPLVRSGPIVHEISALAKAQNLDLVVISTHARGGFSRALYGSMAERILHHAPCPILIVRAQERGFVDDSPALGKDVRINRILVPVDFTGCSKKAVRYAEAFARRFNAELHCVHFLEPERPLIVVETESYRKTHEAEAGPKMTALLREMDASLRVESAIKSGDPHREIVGCADERKVDLIVLGEHNRSGARRFLIGSTTDEVVQQAHCPVLVVRESEHEFLV